MVHSNDRELIEHDSARSSFRWVMLALMSFLYGCFGLAVTSIAPMVNTIAKELSISSSQMGTILGAWQLVYIGLAYQSGSLLDRFGVKGSVAAGATAIALSLFVRAVAVDFVTLLLAIIIFGLGGSMISVGSPKVASMWFSGRQRGMATSVSFAGSILGSVIGMALTSAVVVPLLGSWRLAFVFYGVITVIATIVWLLLARNQVPGVEDFGDTEQHQAGNLKRIIAIDNVRLIVVLGFSVFLLNHGLRNWLPVLLIEKGISEANAGFLAAIPLVVGMITMLIIPSVVKSGYRRPTVIILLMIAGLTAIPLALGEGVVVLVFLVISGAVRQPLNSLLLLLLMDTKGVGSSRIGAAGGFFFAVSEIGGFGGPFVVGVLRDITGDAQLGIIVIGLVMVALTPLAFKVNDYKIRDNS
jgi:CP family cyanate transporter-like MFS transporter